MSYCELLEYALSLMTGVLNGRGLAQTEEATVLAKADAETGAGQPRASKRLEPPEAPEAGRNPP